jgi:hypothetical protein
MVARIGVGAGAEAADAPHQLVGIDVGADLAGFRGGGQQFGAHRNEAVEEIGVQSGKANTVGSQDRG